MSAEVNKLCNPKNPQNNVENLYQNIKINSTTFWLYPSDRVGLSWKRTRQPFNIRFSAFQRHFNPWGFIKAWINFQGIRKYLLKQDSKTSILFCKK